VLAGQQLELCGYPLGKWRCGQFATRKVGFRKYCETHAQMVEANRRILCEMNERIDRQRSSNPPCQ
jgi:hypothetical protein